MPGTYTYPGVYIEEIPSGVRTITGVATSIAAFIGRAERGPVDEAATVNSYADFERMFGGLWTESSLGYAVRDFYRNGGGRAIIVRLFHAAEGNEGTASISIGDLNLTAASAGSWGDSLRVRIDHDTREPEAGESDDELFNLFVLDGETGETEEFRNVAVSSGHARRIDKVLEAGSDLVRVSGALPAARPAAHADPPAGGDIWGDNDPATNSAVADDARGSDGEAIELDDFTGEGKQSGKQGLYALEQADLFNLLCIPPYAADDVDNDLLSEAASYCVKRRAMLLIDPPSAWVTKQAAVDGIGNLGGGSTNAAVFFPRIEQTDPLKDNQIAVRVPCGAVAGVFARTDGESGVWKAPAGLGATLVGVPSLAVELTDAENGELNPLGVNCLRIFAAAGRVVWGARTRRGDDRLASEWKYIPVRRTALFIEESLYRGTQWVVFEPNDEPLWSAIRLNVGAFMHNLFQQGAFQGSSAREAYFVKCDKETTTQNDIDRGIVNILVGFAPLKPAEFVVIKIQQIAGQQAA
jgi:phage tail sheath protein FI